MVERPMDGTGILAACRAQPCTMRHGSPVWLFPAPHAPLGEAVTSADTSQQPEQSISACDGAPSIANMAIKRTISKGR